MAKNFKDFIATEIIKYLKERDEEIQRLRRGLDQFKLVTNKIQECAKCHEWISDSIYDTDDITNNITNCLGCITKMCKECRKYNGFYETFNMSMSQPISFWYCGNCKYSGTQRA